MASGVITLWQIDRETKKTVKDFLFWGSKITVDGDYTHENKRHFLLGRNVMTNLDNLLKSRDITLPTKVCLVKAMVFPVIMYGCESWTIKEAECWRIDAFELCCWRTLLRVPLTARRSNQSILKEISPEYIAMTDAEAETPILWPPDVKNWHLKKPWCGERLKAGEEGDNRRWDGWMAPPAWWTWFWISSGRWWWTGKPGMLLDYGVTMSQKWLSDWTELNKTVFLRDKWNNFKNWQRQTNLL